MGCTVWMQFEQLEQGQTMWNVHELLESKCRMKWFQNNGLSVDFKVEKDNDKFITGSEFLSLIILLK